MNVFITMGYTDKQTWFGFSDSFWGAVLGATLPVILGLIGMIIKSRIDKKNKNTRTFSKINYELNKFVQTTSTYNFCDEETAILLEEKCILLVNELSSLNIDALAHKEVLTFYEIINVIDDIGKSTYEIEEVVDDYNQVLGVITHPTPSNFSEKLKKLEEKHKKLVKKYLY